MSISSVSSSASTSFSSGSITDEITQLEKQKASLQKELQKENQSKDDAKTKELKVKQIQMEIQQIDAQIQQKKSGKSGQSQNTGQSQMPPPQKTPDGMNGANKTSDSAKEGLSGNTIDVQI